MSALAIQLLSEGAERSGLKTLLRVLGGHLARALRFAETENMELSWFKFVAGLKLPGHQPQIQDQTQPRSRTVIPEEVEDSDRA